MGGALSYSELDVTALLDSHGERLYLYFWLMLGDDLSATRALTDTIIGVLPDPHHRELFTVARRVCRQYRPVPAALSAEAGVATLAAVTIVALRRLDPDEREICVLGESAPAATMPPGAPMVTAPSRMVTPAPSSTPATVTAPPTMPTMSPTPTVPPTVAPTTPASPTPSPSDD